MAETNGCNTLHTTGATHPSFRCRMRASLKVWLGCPSRLEFEPCANAITERHLARFLNRRGSQWRQLLFQQHWFVKVHCASTPRRYRFETSSVQIFTRLINWTPTTRDRASSVYLMRDVPSDLQIIFSMGRLKRTRFCQPPSSWRRTRISRSTLRQTQSPLMSIRSVHLMSLMVSTELPDSFSGTEELGNARFRNPREHCS